MRNLKKFLALVLATLMVVSAAATVSAYAVFDDVEDGNPYAEAIGTLVEYGLTKGIGDSLYGVDLPVRRYQMALFVARALAPNEDWNGEGAVIFPDVKEYSAAIAFVNNKGIVNGMPDGTFAPDAQIKYQDALLMILRTLGYTVDTSCTPYWVNAYKMAKELGLTENVNISESSVFSKDNYLNRAETAQIIYNLLNAKPADGGLTIAQKNFGAEVKPEEPEVKPVTTEDIYVITITPKQAYTAGDKDILDLDYVGIQPLVNGVPEGDVKYISIDTLGIAKADVEKYFNYSVALYNLVDDDGVFVECESAELCEAPVKAYAKEIAKVSNTAKFKYDGVTYTVTDAYTNSTVRNEIVVFNGNTSSVTNKVLLFDANGNIVNAAGTKVASLIVAPNGTKNYVKTTAEADGTYSVLSESEAKAAFGIELNDEFTKFDTLKIDNLDKNYELTLFDDNGDGKYDRAFKATVYMSAYKAPAEGVCQIDGLKDLVVKAGYADKKGVKGLDGLVAGNVFTYTYNGKTNTVDVIDILSTGSGVVSKVTPKVYSSTNTNVYYVVTIDGVDYTLANNYRSTNGYIGAIVNTTDGIAYNKIAEKGSMSYVNDAYKDIVIGKTFTFLTTKNNEIIAGASEVASSTTPDKIIIKGAKTYDENKNLIVDAYVNGVLKELKVSVVDTVKLHELSDFKFSTEINTLVVGDSAKIALGKTFNGVNKTDGTVELTTAKLEDQYTKAVYSSTKDLVFTDGIADNISKDDYAIRTTSSTIFVFVAKKEIKVFNGQPAKDKAIKLDNVDAIYADKIGYTLSNKGESGIVIVMCKTDKVDNTVTTFWKAADAPTYTVMLLNDSNVTDYVRASAATFGLEGNDIYRKYTVDAINLNDGTDVDTLYVKEESNGTVKVNLTTMAGFKVDKATGVVTETAPVKNATLSAAKFKQARYWTIEGVTVADKDLHKVTTVKLTDAAKYVLVENDVAKVLASGDYTVYYVSSGEAATFIGVAVKG